MPTSLVTLLPPAAALTALVFALLFYRDMYRRDEGTEVMRRIGGHVRDGAMAYLRQQYRIMLWVFLGLAALFALLAWGLGVQSTWLPATFLCGGFFSALAGFFGMRTATLASTRTAAAARFTGCKPARCLSQRCGDRPDRGRPGPG